MQGHDIIVVGASAGGVEALSYLVKNLPSDLNATVFIVLHVPSEGTSVLPRILNRAKGLPVSHAQNGEAFVKGRIYVAPPDYHLLVKPGYISLVGDPEKIAIAQLSIHYFVAPRSPTGGEWSQLC